MTSFLANDGGNSSALYEEETAPEKDKEKKSNGTRTSGNLADMSEGYESPEETDSGKRRASGIYILLLSAGISYILKWGL